MGVEVYINFNGNCRQAVDFYSDVFGTEKPKIMLFGDTPPNPEFPLDEEMKKLVMHATLNIEGSMVMFSDVPPGMTFVEGNNITLIINSKDTEKITTIFNKLKEGGTIRMDLQETFWSKLYGYVVDKFGIGWQLNYDNGQM